MLLTAEDRAKTVGGDKNFDVASFVAAVRELVDWILTFTAAAYNLVRMRTLLARA